MKRFFMQIVVYFALLTCLLAVSALAVSDGETVRVGLAYGSNALAAANLENSVGSGHRFGYYDSQGQFILLGSTGESQISMLKTQNLYLAGDGTYTTSAMGSVVGCYHIQLPGSYGSFEQASGAAAALNGAFPAWISGTYYVRVGSYATSAQAQAAASNAGISGTIVGTSAYGISITQTKTTKILFQFDSGGSQIFAVKPGKSGTGETQTWFKGYKYNGDFLYERISGGNLTVVNRVTMDEYIKGIIPYEMSPSWPIEALKAQAVAARSYSVAAVGNKHTAYHFDVCNTVCCQTYRGTNRANDTTNAAVDATSGIYARYHGAIAQTYYYASDGGATEDVANVWSSTIPYLTGKIDPYEADIAGSVSNYSWTKTYTGDQLTALLQSKGYSCGQIVDMAVRQFTPLGNVYTVTFTDSAGRTYDVSKEKARNLLGVPSIRFTISGGSGGSSGSYYVDGGETSLPSLEGIYALDGAGNPVPLGGSGLYVITSGGTTALAASSGTSPVAASDTFVLSGAGNGHSVGMSQWGAYAMAKRGYTYDQILKFYYTGIDLY